MHTEEKNVNKINSNRKSETLEVEITRCEITNSFRDQATVEWRYRILSGPNAGKSFCDTSFLKTPKAWEYFEKVCKTLGVPYSNSQDLRSACSKMVGRKLSMDHVVTHSYYVNAAIR